MKKLLLCVVALGATVVMQAQHVDPLDSLTTNLQMDSIRAQYAGNVAGMLGALQLTQLSIEADSKMLKEASSQLKSETNYSKSVESYLKTSTDVLEDLKKSYEQDLSNLQKIQNAVNDELNALHKVTLKDQEYTSAMESKLQGYVTTIHDAIDRINGLLRNIDAQVQEATRQQTDLDAFKREIEGKEQALKSLQEQNKSDKDAVKNEMKVWKKLMPKK